MSNIYNLEPPTKGKVGCCSTPVLLRHAGVASQVQQPISTVLRRYGSGVVAGTSYSCTRSTASRILLAAHVTCIVALGDGCLCMLELGEWQETVMHGPVNVFVSYRSL